MPEPIRPGAVVDGFTVGERVHAGAQGGIFHVTVADPARDTGFPIVMKVPHVGYGQDLESLLNFETECNILPALSGVHVPRFVAAGDITRQPYLVMEWVDGRSLRHRLDDGVLPSHEVAAVGAAIADALLSLHRQRVVHHDLKPENVIVAPDGKIVLIDFGLAHHALYPDLLAEETRYAAGSAPYVSPEQVMGCRSDARSDIFALGVLLYEAATGELPFGVPRSFAGLRDRIWKDPVPPRARKTDIPPWLQEIILRCIEVDADERYQTAAYVALDLRNPGQMPLSSRAARLAGSGFWRQASRWWRGSRGEFIVRRPGAGLVRGAPVIMVAVDTTHPDDPRHAEMQRETALVLSRSPEFRLICVSAVRPSGIGSADGRNSASGSNLDHLIRLRHWVEPLRLPRERQSLHVIEADNAASAILKFARANHVDLLILGAPGPEQKAMAWWRSVASSVTANAHCSVHVVRVPDRGIADAQAGDAAAQDGGLAGV